MSDNQKTRKHDGEAVSLQGKIVIKIDKIAKHLYEQLVLWCTDIQAFKIDFPDKRPDPRGIEFDLERLLIFGKEHPLWNLTGDAMSAAIQRLVTNGRIRQTSIGNKLYLTPVIEPDKKRQLMIRRAVKAEMKSQLSDDILVAAYKQQGSCRKAAEALSEATGKKISKDKVQRAVQRTGGFQAMRSDESSSSVARTTLSQRHVTKKKILRDE